MVKFNQLIFLCRCSESSFESLTLWVEEYKHYTVAEKVFKVLIGNKSDLMESKKVELNAARKFAEQYGMKVYEVSSKSDNDKKNIETIFTTMAEKLHKEKKPAVLKKPSVVNHTTSPQLIDSEKNLTLKNEKTKQEKEKKKCCGSGS